ncbi:hypothetical protein SUGI_0552550 [Cryptomeria japonica]|nr:hypothetical protein SUGI_0552550 [Cryptomeria japonica]
MTLNRIWRTVLLNQNSYYTDNTRHYQRHAISNSVVFYVVRLGALESLHIYHQGALKTVPLLPKPMPARPLNEAEQKWRSSVSMQFLNGAHQFVKPKHPPQYLYLYNTDNCLGSLLKRHIVLRPYFSKHNHKVPNLCSNSKQMLFSVIDDFEGEKIKSIHCFEKVGSKVLCYKIYFQNAQSILGCSDVARADWSDKGRKLVFSLSLLRDESFYEVNMAQQEAMYIWESL